MKESVKSGAANNRIYPYIKHLYTKYRVQPFPQSMEKFTYNIDISQVVLRNNESSISTTVDAGISEVYIKLNERDFKLTYQVTH